MSLPLWTIKILQMLPQPQLVRAHLSDCAAHEVLYRKLDPALPALRFIDVFRFGKKISGAERLLDRHGSRIEAPMQRCEVTRAVTAPTVVYGVQFGQKRVKPLH
jgi:hypothetical protein